LEQTRATPPYSTRIGRLRAAAAQVRRNGSISWVRKITVAEHGSRAGTG
jgi:hypothetical protein